MKISKVVIPAAGLGTRFLPITKSIPKEMLPILEKPAIHYIIQEAFKADLNNVFIIQNSSKTSISSYFDFSTYLDTYLEMNNKRQLISELEILRKSLNFAFINQYEPLGLGHAVYMAKACIQDEYFAVMLPDDLILGEDILNLKTIAYENRCSVIAVMEVPQDKISSYGIISIGREINSDMFEVSNLIEKPKENSPSNLAIIGRYILSSKIFHSLENIKKGAGQEYQLTDAILDMLKNGEKIIAYKLNANRFDIGTPAGWLNANLYFASKNKDFHILNSNNPNLIQI
jgi:UTP--glucose-1-phosphate uridylyltransferase